MAILEDMFKGNVTTGLAIGIGALIVAPALLPAVGRVIRPAAKAAIKGGMIAYRQTVGEIGEVAGDIIAEVRAELEEEGREAVAATTRASRAASSGRTEAKQH